MATPMTPAPRRTYRMARMLTSLRSCCTVGWRGWPSECARGSVIVDLPLPGRLLEVELVEVGGALAVGVVQRQQRAALELPEEVRQPQPAQAQRRQEVHPVLAQPGPRKGRQHL